MAITAVLAITLCSAVMPTYRRGECVLRDNVEIYGIPAEMHFIPFRDNNVGKYGFLQNTSRISVKIEPTYDDIEITTLMLIPVKKGGKWGVVDIGARYIGYSRGNPIIPCVYNEIHVISNNIAVCDGIEIDISKQGYEKWR